MLRAVFYTRSFSQILDTPFIWDVESFDWDMTWGPTLAVLTAKEVDVNFEASKLVRCPVEIINGDGWPVWWGFVHTASMPHESMSIGVSVENMWNKVKTVYSNLPAGSNIPAGQGTTAWATGDDSIGEFGTKEYIESMADATPAAATARRDRILRECKYPNVTIDPYSSGVTKLSLRGWGDTLIWRRADQSSVTLTETTTQIGTIVSTYGQFIRGTHIGTVSGITTNPYLDGTTTAKKAVEELVKNGISGGGRLKAIVNQERYLRLDSVTTPATPDYQMRNDGKLEMLSDAPIDEERLELAIGKWAALKSAPAVIGNFATIHPFLIEAASWQKGRGAAYRPVGQTDILKITQVGVN